MNLPPQGQGSTREGCQEQDADESILGCAAKPRCCNLGVSWHKLIECVLHMCMHGHACHWTDMWVIGQSVKSVVT